VDDGERYPDIGDYALIGDCHTAALVSRTGSIDWCCMPRFDSGSVFGRLLDWERGGSCAITASTSRGSVTRRYLDGTLVLETLFETEGGAAVVRDCFTMRSGGARQPYRQLLRVVEGVRGRTPFDVQVTPRFDYGDLRPWIRRRSSDVFVAIGGDDALVISGDIPLELGDDHDLVGTIEAREGARHRLSIVWAHPEDVDLDAPQSADASELDRRFDATVRWWETWSRKLELPRSCTTTSLRSAIVLKSMVHAPTGAVVAAPTTSLPEALDGERNWDYRYSWIRDSAFAVRSLAALGAHSEADGFRRFVERSAGGSAHSLQIMYGVGGERRLTELTLDLDGYRGARPVRIGNAASTQRQLDVYGYVLDLAWSWHERGHSPDDDYWRFLVSIVDHVVEVWSSPDRGIWEMRAEPQHFVQSKAMCWVAVDRGVSLAEACMRVAPLERWAAARDEIRAAIEEHGVDRERGVFTQTFGGRDVDASLLLLPMFGFVDWDDDRMRRTVDAVRDELLSDGLLARYRTEDALSGNEGVFVACTFWLAECLAHQGRLDDARAAFEQAERTANDLGLFAEEWSTAQDIALGNFPQGLSHLAHISAAVAIARATEARVSRG
jgi:GH15 family glucan-1,4-alpha-glucosidase